MHDGLRDLRDEVVGWCAGRSWPWRAVLLAGMAWMGVRILGDPLYASPFDALDLGIHEGGHLLFSWLPGQWLMVAGGTLLQLAAPVMSAVLFFRQPDYFAVTVCGGWLAANLFNVAVYVADARTLELPLVTVGDGEALHDWNYLLGSVGLLGADAALAALLRLLAFASLGAALALGGWMLVVMARSPREE